MSDSCKRKIFCKILVSVVFMTVHECLSHDIETSINNESHLQYEVLVEIT